MIKQPPRTAPTSALGGALAIIVVWLVSLTGVDVPSLVAAAFAVVFTWSAAYLPVPRRLNRNIAS